MIGEIKLIYHGTVYSKKNSKRIIRNRQTGRMALIASEAAQENERNMAEQFKAQPCRPLNYPCGVNVKIFEPNYARRDLDNQLTSILDALRVANVIEDDDWRHITSASIEVGGIDKDKPRAEITITEAEETGKNKVVEINK